MASEAIQLNLEELAKMSRALTHRDYTVAWICALPLEMTAACAMLDEKHDRLPRRAQDTNTYALGRIANHNVAITCLPEYGTVRAATAAMAMAATFPSIQIRLMVGIGGGIPSKAYDIRLGDVVVSMPTGQQPGVVQYDLGKLERGGDFQRKGTLCKPPAELLTAARVLQATKPDLERAISGNISTGFGKWFPDSALAIKYLGATADRLFRADYEHVNKNLTCKDCSKLKEIVRKDRNDTHPVIHYGNIASGNQVMKDGVVRDRLGKNGDMICFEMEAAGLMDNFPCLVIRGISDYSDSHKNKPWQKYAAATAAGYAKELLLIISPRAVEKPEPIFNNKFWHVPRQVNSFFTGRARILRTIQEKCCSPNHDSTQRRFVIHGEGGAGKSEICLKFANINRETFWAVLWVDASSITTMTLGITKAVNICGADVSNLEDAKKWLENLHQAWLLILDNCDDKKIDYAEYFPSGNRGTILMTTRNPHCKIHNTVGQEHLDKLDIDDAAQLLLKSSGIENEMWQTRYSSAVEVVTILSSHALAIVQAGAFIRTNHCTLDEYPIEFRRQRTRLLNEFPDSQGQPTYGNVYATFEVSAKALQESEDQEAADALELLKILGFLHFDGVPKEIFTRAWTYAQELKETDPHEAIDSLSSWHVSKLPKLMREEAANDLSMFSLRKAIDVLYSFSIIAVHPETGDISMHPLGHSWAKDRLSRTEQDDIWVTAAATLALSTEGNKGYNYFWRKLQHHIESCLDHMNDDQFKMCTDIGAAQMLYMLCWPLYRMNIEIRASDIAKFIFGKWSSAFPPESRNWCEIRHLQALCVLDTSEVTEAIKFLIEIVRIRREGNPTDVALLASLQVLANAHMKLDQYEDAVKLIEEVVEIQKKTLDVTHYSRLGSQDELANAYMGLGRCKEAIELLIEVVDIRRTTLEPTNPMRLGSQHSLAHGYMELDQYEEATELLTEVVEIEKTILDPTNPSRLSSQHELARAYMGLDRYKEAIELLREVVDIRRTTLDPTNPKRLASQHELARAYIGLDQFKEAIELLVEVVDMRRKTLDSTNPLLLGSQYALARAYMELDQCKEAIELLTEVVDIRRATLDPTNPRRLASQHELARAYLGLDQYEEAIELLIEVVDIRKTTLDPTDPACLGPQHGLSLAYIGLNRYKEAIELLIHIIDIQKTIFDPMDPRRLISQHELARAYIGLEQFKEAIPLLEEVVEIEKNTLDPMDGSRILSEKLLSKCYASLNKPKPSSSNRVSRIPTRIRHQSDERRREVR